LKDQELVSTLRKHPNTLGVDGSFGQLAAFIGGVDEGQDRRFLTGFHEWLTVKLDYGENLGWPALVQHSAFSGRKTPPLTAEEDAHAAKVLLQLLSDFLEARDRPDGMVKIYDAYAQWLRRQQWYSPEVPHYLDHSD
jgi:hypothetical protein